MFIVTGGGALIVQVIQTFTGQVGTGAEGGVEVIVTGGMLMMHVGQLFPGEGLGRGIGGGGSEGLPTIWPGQG